MIFIPSQAAANEILATTPQFGWGLFGDVSAWVNDHFAFRQEMVTAWAWLNSSLFKTSTEDQVILGQNDWLYYRADLGNELCDDELRIIASNILDIQKAMEETGADFIFTIAPDKSNIHGDNLPNIVTTDSMGRKIKPYLEEVGVNYVDLFDKSIPYFQTDSHWTSYGAAMACDKLIGSNYSSRTFDIEDSHKGDLYEMLYPAGIMKEADNKCNLDYKTHGSTNGGNAITITATGNGEGTLFCYRDSFGVALYPYLADAFENSIFSRATDYSADNVGDADLVILEIVERNLKNFL